MPQILIIENDTAFASILAEFLEEDPSIKIAGIIDNEDEAMTFIRSKAINDIDCALVDLMLPKFRNERTTSSMAGLRLVQELRFGSHFPGLILIVTNSRSFADGERALAAGCDGYLCKHASMDSIPRMVSELKLAMRGGVMLVSKEMRHVFLREDLSIKESELMDMIDKGATWADIADKLGYASTKAAASIGYRVFEKLLAKGDQSALGGDSDTKRARALEVWRARSQAPTHQ